MPGPDPVNFEATWTIVDEGNAKWAQRLRKGDTFSITRQGPRLAFAPGSMMGSEMQPDPDPAQTELEPADSGPNGNDPYPGALRIHFPNIRRYVLFRVSQNGKRREIWLFAGDEAHSKDPHAIINHGGPHGVG